MGASSVLKDSEGNIIGAIESIRDITKRRRAELALKGVQQHLADIINIPPRCDLRH